jgi:hypothetical protein
MWNQVGSECKVSLYYNPQLIRICTAVLLIRTYAFFNRNIYVLAGLIVAIAGVVAYQLYVDLSQMLRT